MRVILAAATTGVTIALTTLLVASLAACGDGGGPSATSPAPTAVLALLKTDPENGPVGTTVTITGEGLPAGKTAELIWVTVDGAYDVKLQNNRQEFYERTFTEKRVSLDHAAIDGQGRVAFTFTVPEDYGEVHDIYVAVDGQDVGKGGFFVTRAFTASSQDGPVGTLISIKVTGLGWKPFASTLAVRWDNSYTGFISATTTRGTAVAQIRAAGPPGQHLIELIPASHLLPYMNAQQSPVSYLITFRLPFMVTADPGPAAASLDWPDSNRVVVNADAARTTLTGATPAGTSASLSPTEGPILTKANFKASGLPPSSTADLSWVTVSGNDLFGWNLASQPLSKVNIGQDGSIDAEVTVPEGLGGWHAVTVVQNEKTLAEVPFFLERSLVGVTPTKVKAGEKFTIELKGVGWTEIDNGVAITYDNAYVGYACGFASQGDVTVELVATGGPGTHLIDLYPMIYDGGHGKWPWQYNLPQLTALEDHPSLGLGYRLPIFRLAIEVD